MSDKELGTRPEEEEKTPEQRFSDVFGQPAEKADPKTVITIILGRYDTVKRLHTLAVMAENHPWERKTYLGSNNWLQFNTQITSSQNSLNEALAAAQPYLDEDLKFLADNAFTLSHVATAEVLLSHSNLSDQQREVLRGNVTLRTTPKTSPIQQ